jgi:hypothetical protein
MGECRRHVAPVAAHSEQHHPETIDIPVEPGRHTLQVRNGRNYSRTKAFNVGSIASMSRDRHLVIRDLVDDMFDVTLRPGL